MTLSLALTALGCQSVVAPGGDKKSGRYVVSATEWVVYRPEQVRSVQVTVDGRRVDNLSQVQLDT